MVCKHAGIYSTWYDFGPLVGSDYYSMRMYHYDREYNYRCTLVSVPNSDYISGQSATVHYYGTT